MVLATRTRNGMAPEVRGLVDLAEHQEWEVEVTASGRLRFSKDGQDPVFCSQDPGDARAYLNARADLERHGLDLRRRRRRRRAVVAAAAAVPTTERDPVLEELADDLLVYAEQLEDVVGRLIRRLHDQGEAGLHAWSAEACHRVCAEALALVAGSPGSEQP